MDRAVIIRALEEQRVMRISYAGGGQRIVQPHAILRKPDGTELLEAYQVRGFTDTDLEYGWRHFDLSRIDEMTLMRTRFEPRRDFKQVSGSSGQLVARVGEDVRGGL
ncbi:MAG: WYL domain-containing protein [Gemmatimonadaceae bacterium]